MLKLMALLLLLLLLLLPPLPMPVAARMLPTDRVVQKGQHPSGRAQSSPALPPR